MAQNSIADVAEIATADRAESSTVDLAESPTVKKSNPIFISENYMRDTRKSRRGASSIMAVLFVSIFSMLALSFTSMSSTGLQTASNQQGIAQAQAAAESGLQYARCLINSYSPPASAYTTTNTVSQSEAELTFGYFASHVANSLSSVSTSYDSQANELTVASGSGVQLPGSQAAFSLTFAFDAGDVDYPHRMTVISNGSSGIASRSAQLVFPIKKDWLNLPEV